MPRVTAQAVKDLREATDMGLMACKNALDLCLGHADLAAIYLRHKGNAVAYRDEAMRPENKAIAEAHRRGM